MLRFGSRVITAMVLVAALTGCATASDPASTHDGRESPAVSATPNSQTVTPLATPSDGNAPASTSPPTSEAGQADGGTPPPAPAVAVPQRVVGVTATTGGGSGEVLLRWSQNPEPDVVTYTVLRATSSGGALTQIGTVTREEVTQFEYVPFVDSDATVAYYRVRAVDSAGQEGALSAEVCGASYGHSC